MDTSRPTACNSLTHDENSPFIFQLTLPNPPAAMRKISIAFHISKLPMAKFECNTCTTSLGTLQDLFFYHQSKEKRDDQELIQSDPTSCPQNQMGNN